MRDINRQIFLDLRFNGAMTETLETRNINIDSKKDCIQILHVVITYIHDVYIESYLSCVQT